MFKLLYVANVGCGKKSTDAQTLIVGGTKAKQGDYPWQAAIYRKDLNYKNICGGSLISLQTVISGKYERTSLST